MMSSKLVFHVRSSWSTICPRRLSSTSGLYCAAVGKHDAKFLDEHLSSVAFDAWLKTLIRPCARGPGVSAIGGAGVGDGERESGFVAAGMITYGCEAICDGQIEVSLIVPGWCLLKNALARHVMARVAKSPHFPASNYLQASPTTTLLESSNSISPRPSTRSRKMRPTIHSAEEDAIWYWSQTPSHVPKD
jgi:hypothetical protein